MDDSDIDDLIGGNEPPTAPLRVSRRRSRARPADTVPPLELIDLGDIPDSTAIKRQAAITRASTGHMFVDSGELKRPVSASFLSQVFDMDPATIKKRLLHCPPLGSGGGNRPVYDFREAVAFLIPPQMDIEDYLNSMDPNTLPNHINKAFWEAKKIRLNYMLAAGDAWHTDDVLAVFGQTFMTIKNVTQLWVETIRDAGGLSDEQYVTLQQLVDGLQNNLHAELLEIPKKGATKPLATEEGGEG